MTTLLKPAEVARRLAVSRRQAYYLIETGALPSVKLSTQSVRVIESDLNDYIVSRRSADARTS